MILDYKPKSNLRLLYRFLESLLLIPVKTNMEAVQTMILTTESNMLTEPQVPLCINIQCIFTDVTSPKIKTPWKHKELDEDVTE